jgi:hypothetical protein
MARRVAGLSGRGLHALPAEGRRAASTTTSRGIRPCAAVLAPTDVLVADANTGLAAARGRRASSARCATSTVYVEQPCATYEECLSIRRRTDHPFVLDETIDSMAVLLRAAGDRAMDVVNLKISKLGGPDAHAPGARPLRLAGRRHDARGFWGGDVVTAAIRAPRPLDAYAVLFTATDFNSYVTVSTAEGAPKRRNGRMAGVGGAGPGGSALGRSC